MIRKRQIITLLILGLITGIFLFIQAYFIYKKYHAEKNELIKSMNESLQSGVNSFSNYYFNHKEFQRLVNENNTHAVQNLNCPLGPNLLRNPDFEEGLSDFESEYSVLGGIVINIFPNKFGWVWVTADPGQKLNAWAGKGFNGKGNFLLVDGAAVPERKFWKQKITVKTGTRYAFSLALSSVINDTAKIWQQGLVKIYVNGKEIGHVLSPALPPKWISSSFVWHSNKDTLAEISLADVNSASDFNDFGLDHLAFHELINCEIKEAYPLPAPETASLSINYMHVLSDLFEKELQVKNIFVSHKLEKINNKGKDKTIELGTNAETNHEGANHYFSAYYVKEGRVFTNYFYISNDEYVKCEIIGLETYILRKLKIEWVLFLIMLISSVAMLVFFRSYLKKQEEISNLKYQLINNVNHELKTPIATLSVAIEALQTFNQIEDKQKAGQYLDIAKKQIKKLDQIIDNSFQLARIEEKDFKLKTELLDIGKTVAELIEEKKEAYTTPVHIYLEVITPGILIKADPFHLKNILSTVLDNSVKYTAAVPEIHVSVKQQGGYAVLRIKDNGIGIEAKYHKLVFDKFFRVPTEHHNVKGHGLGLSYVKLITKLHNAKIELHSDLNKGTEIILKFTHE